MDATDAKTPGAETAHEIVERVPELGEQQQALIRAVEETFLPQDASLPGDGAPGEIRTPDLLVRSQMLYPG